MIEGKKRQQKRSHFRRKRIGIDLDGVICKGEHWREGKDVLSGKPNGEIIDLINRLYQFHFIVIYTARQDYLISDTLVWLRSHNVHFHAISNNKIPLDFYFDDKGYQPKEVRKLLLRSR